MGFYRSTGERAMQRTHAVLEACGWLKWLPLKAIAYSDCQAENRLAPGAEFLGQDATALVLPHAEQPLRQAALCSTSRCPACGWSTATLMPPTMRC